MDYMYSWELPHIAAAIKLAEDFAATKRLVSAHEAASEIQRPAAIALREREEEYHRAVEKKMSSQESAAFPTPDDRLVGVTKESGPTGPAETSWNQSPAGKLIGLLVEIMVQLELQKWLQQQQQEEEKEEQVLEEVKVVEEEQEEKVEEKEVRENKEEQRNASPPPPPPPRPPPPLWSVAEPDWWLDRMPPSSPSPQQQAKMEGCLLYTSPSPRD